MTLSAPKTAVHLFTPSNSGRERKNISQILVDSGNVSADDMFKAIALQSHENARLPDLLQALGLVNEDTLLEAISEETGLPIVDLEADPPSSQLAGLVHPSLGIRHRFVVWKLMNSMTIIAVSTPDSIDVVQGLIADITHGVKFVLASKKAILRHYEVNHSTQLSKAANTQVPNEHSCRKWVGHRPKIIGVLLLISCMATTFFAPKVALAIALTWILVSLLSNSAYKVFMLISSLSHVTEKPIVKRPPKLPKISILLPLLNESDIVDRLIERMATLVYPKELLEICLIYEQSDHATRQHLEGRRLPNWMRTIEVPPDTLQTKPRAMNYALDYCNGEIIGIYDAEDAPEPDQLFRIVQEFANSPPNVACVQCQLDYYNSDTNWISRCFSIEYAILFRVVLPSLVQKNLPVPLGGTSVFFRREILEKLGRWDAQNVTEDADLGIRLHRMGYRCAWCPATTYEEANFRILPWMRQRSRWLKGFLQTWITHMRHPRQTLRQLGLAGFLVFQIQMLGTFSSFAIAPLVLPMWLFSLGYSLPVYEAIPTSLFQFLVGCFVVTELLLLLIGLVAVNKRGGKNLVFFVPLMLFYWPLGAFSAYKALWELFVHPHYWDKTAHGINDTDYQTEIERLTASPVARANVNSPFSLTVTGG